MDKTTVMTMLGVMADEMIFEWSYQLRDDPRPEARQVYQVVREYAGPDAC